MQCFVLLLFFLIYLLSFHLVLCLFLCRDFAAGICNKISEMIQGMYKY